MSELTDVTAVVNLKSEDRIYNSVSSYESRSTTNKKTPFFNRLMDEWIIHNQSQKEKKVRDFKTFENLGLEARLDSYKQRDLRFLN